MQKTKTTETTKAATKTPRLGARMPDGTIYAGISPDTKQPMYAAPDDGAYMTFQQAQKYAAELTVGDKKDFRLPTVREMNVIFQNRDKGALKGTFNMEAKRSSSWYWYTRKRHYDDLGESAQHITDGLRVAAAEGNRLSVRCVR